MVLDKIKIKTGSLLNMIALTFSRQSLYARRFYSIFIPELLQMSGSCILPRGVIRVWGPDVGKFLQGMCTGDALAWSTNPTFKGEFTSFLTPQGRIMYESFVYNMSALKSGSNDYHRPCDEGFLIDCDRQAVGDFLIHLKWYRLRSKVEFEDLTHQWAVRAAWNQTSSSSPSMNIPDHRCDWNMVRTCQPKSSDIISSTSDNCQVYNTLRMIKGVPEGCLEITRRMAIPLEYNFDLMGALSSQKGCYLGQELVTRTLQRGVIRKRVIPIQLFDWGQPLDRNTFIPDPARNFPGIEVGTELVPVAPNDANKPEEITALHPKYSFGKLVAMNGNLGLALARLDLLPPNGLFAVHRPHPDEGDKTFIIGRAIIPEWWPVNLRSSTTSDNPNITL